MPPKMSGRQRKKAAAAVAKVSDRGDQLSSKGRGGRRQAQERSTVATTPVQLEKPVRPSDISRRRRRTAAEGAAEASVQVQASVSPRAGSGESLGMTNSEVEKAVDGVMRARRELAERAAVQLLELRLAEEAAEAAEKAEAELCEQLGVSKEKEAEPYTCGAGLCGMISGVLILLLWLRFAPKIDDLG
jgi:hypothetical protein